MSLLLLAPEIQEVILLGKAAPKDKELRALARIADWETQRRQFASSNPLIEQRNGPKPIKHAISVP